MNNFASIPTTLDQVLQLVYGGLPPNRGAATGELLHVGRFPLGGDHAQLQSWRVACGADPKVHFSLQLALPASSGQGFPVLVSGDACWAYLDDAVKGLVLGRGCALAWFNRTEIAEDLAGGGVQRRGPLYRCHPDSSFGALSAWAWGFQRALDVLEAHPAIDRHRMGVVGHSRGGKAALIAGATDQRVWLTAANNAGSAGSASHRLQGPGSETLADLCRVFPHWMGPELAASLVQPLGLAFDQDVLLAAIAPRKLIVTQAQDDLWANPIGTRHVMQLAATGYARAGRSEALRLVERPGGHPQLLTDWQAVLDFAMDA